MSKEKEIQKKVIRLNKEVPKLARAIANELENASCYVSVSLPHTIYKSNYMWCLERAEADAERLSRLLKRGIDDIDRIIERKERKKK